MSVRRWSENVLLAELASEPEVREEIESVVREVRDRGDCDVVMDLSNVNILTSTSLASLLRLRTLLESCGQRLLLCCIDHTTRGIFSVTGLDDAFEMMDSQSDALTSIQAEPSPV